MKFASRGAGRSSAEKRLGSMLLIAQVSLSLVLLASAGLLVRGFMEERALKSGYEPERLLDVRIQPPKTKYSGADALLRVYAQIHDEIARIPGVQSVAIVNQEGDAGVRTDVRADGDNRAAGAEPRALYRVVGPNYFATVGQRVLRGRGFTTTDMNPAAQVVVINAHLASRLYPDEESIGKRIRVWKQVASQPDYGQSLDVEVVGVTTDVVFDEASAVSVIYLPFAVSPTPGAWFMVRASGDRSGLVAPIRRAILAVERDVPTDLIGPMTVSTWQAITHRLDVVLVSGFAIAALTLAAIGLYGVVAYIVGQRRHEIGVRRALGATTPNLLRHFVGDGVRLTTLGILIGLPLAAIAGRLMRAMVILDGPFDFATLGVVTVLLFGVATLASYLPARRLSEISPVEALRGE
jgi:putative ABC transport system permease protein